MRWGHRSGWPGDVVARAHAAIGQDEADGVVDLTSGDQSHEGPAGLRGGALPLASG